MKIFYNAYRQFLSWNCFFHLYSLLICITFCSTTVLSQSTYYVDDNASPGGDGSSFAMAFDNIQEAIDASSSNDIIKVAGGVYYPTECPVNSCSDSRDLTILITGKNITIQGGFDPVTELQDLANQQTIFSGDVDQDGILDDGNVYHILLIYNNPAAVQIENIHFKGGNANGSGNLSVGGINNLRNRGGAIVVRGRNTPTTFGRAQFRNCTFTENSGSGGAGGVYNNGLVEVDYYNCIFAQNNSGGNGAAAWNIGRATVEYSFCSFVSNVGASGTAFHGFGTNTTNLLKNCVFWNNTPGDISFGSSASLSNASTNNAALADSDWNSSSNFKEIFFSPFNDDSDIEGPDNVFGTEDDGLLPNALLINNASNAVPASLTSDFIGRPRVADGTADIGAYELPIGDGTKYYVDAATASSGNGLSWADAFKDFEIALSIVDEGDTICVAAGTYYPYTFPIGCTNCDDSRDVSFYIGEDIVVMGSMDPISNMQDLVDYPTILSGDVDQDDVLNNGNVLHVMMIGEDISPDTEISGLIFQDGNANLPASDANTISGRNFENDRGGGLFINRSDPVIKRCRFIDNYAERGAGSCATLSSSTFEECKWEFNNSFTGAAANINRNSNASLYSRCIFNNNTASNSGGAMFNNFSAPTIYNTIFQDNRANNNSEETFGGAIANIAANTYIINCIFQRNTSSTFAGAIYGQAFNENGGTPRIFNSVFYQNSALCGGATAWVQEVELYLYNNIFWDNTNQNCLDDIYIRPEDGQSIADVINIIQAADKNVKEDSPGRSPLNLEEFGTIELTENPFNTADGFPRLVDNSPLIDAGRTDTVGVIMALLGLDNTDFDGFARVNGPNIDIGAFETGMYCEDVTVYLDANGLADLNVLNAPFVLPEGRDTVYSQSVFDCDDDQVLIQLDVENSFGDVIFTCTPTITVLDTLAPEARCKADFSVNLDANTGALSLEVIFIDDESTDNCGIMSREIDKTDFDCTNLGANVVTLTLTDESNNVSSCTTNVEITNSISFTTNVDPGTGCLADDTGTIDFANVQGGLAPYMYSIDGGSNFSVSTSFTNLPEASYSVLVQDANGCRTDPEVVMVTETVDVTAPVPSCPADITVANNSGECFAIIDFVATATDNCDTEVEIAYSQNPNTTFNVGSTTITVTATDDAGLQAQCMFDITVNDTESPTLSCQDATIDLEGSTSFELTNSFLENEIVTANGDNCDLAETPFRVDQNILTCADLGMQDLTVFVDDVNGNTNSCTITLTVINSRASTVNIEGPATICLGEQGVEFIATDLANGEIPVTYEWSLSNGASFTGQGSDAIVVTSAINEAFTIRLVAEDVNGCTETSQLVSPQPALVIAGTDPAEYCPGEEISFELSTSDGAGIAWTGGDALGISDGVIGGLGLVARYPLMNDLTDELGGDDMELRNGAESPSNGAFCSTRLPNPPYIETPTIGNFDRTNFEFSVEFNLSSTSVFQVIMAGERSGFRFIGMIVDNAGNLGIMYNSDITDGINRRYSNTQVESGIWYQASLRILGQVAYLFLNNELIYTRNVGVLIVDSDPTFLSFDGSIARNLVGCIRNLEIYGPDPNASASVTLTGLAPDNTTGEDLNVSLDIEGTFNGCFTSTSKEITINPTPVIASRQTKVCSDVALNLLLDEAIPGTGDTYRYRVSSSNPDEVPPADGRIVESADPITDTYTNTTGADVLITYTILPIGANACQGDLFTIEVTVEPEPVVASRQTSVCSDVALNLLLDNLIPGTGDTYHYRVASSNPDEVPSAEGRIVESAAPITDTYTNTTDEDVLITYTILPIGANGCQGDLFTIEVTVEPEPVVASRQTSVCSDVALNLLLDNLIPGTGDTYRYRVASSNPGEVPPAEGRIVESAAPITDTYTNTTDADVLITYTILPIGANGCQGNLFTIEVTVEPEPVVASRQTSVCSDVALNLLLDNLIPGTGDTYRYRVASSNPTDVPPAEGRIVESAAPITDTYTNTTDANVLITYTILPIGANGCQGDLFTIEVTVQPEPVIIPDTKWICSYERSELNIRQRNTISIDRLVINSVDLDGAVLVDGPEYLEGDEPSFSPDMFASQIYQYEGDGFANIVYNVTPIGTNGCAGNPVNVQINVEFCPVSCNREVRVTLGNFANGRSSQSDNCFFPLDIQHVGVGKEIGIRFGYNILVNDWTPGDNIITSPGTFQYAIIQDIGFDGDPSNDINICWGTVIAEDKSDPVLIPPVGKYLECWLLDDVLNNPGTVAPSGDSDTDNIDDGGDGDDDNDLGIPTWQDCSEASFTWSDAVVNYNCDHPDNPSITAVLTRRFTVQDIYGNSSSATQTIYFVGPRTSIDGDNNVTSADYWGWGPLVDPSDRDGDGVKFYYDVEAGLWVYTLQSCDAPSEQVGELYPYYTGQLDCETGQFNQLVDIDPAPDNVVLGPDYRDAFGNKVRLDEVNCNLSVQTDNRQFSDVCSDGSYKQERHLRIFDWCEGSSDGTAFPYLVKVGDFAPPVLDNCVLNPLDVPGVRRRTNFGDAETVIELLNGDTDGDGDLENDQIRPEHIEAGQITFFDDEDEELKDEGYTVSVCLEMVSTGPMDCTASLNTDLGALRALWGKQLVQDCEDPTVTSEIYSYSEVYVGGFPTGEYAWQIGGYSMVGTMAVGIPEGLHALVFSATDNCYNSTLGMIFFTVMDGTKPVMKCDDELRVTLVDGDPKLQIQGYALATAQDVDEGSWDNCGPVDLHVRRIINDADVQADWEAKNGRLLIDEYDDNDPDYNQGYTGWDDLVEFFCGDLDEKVTVELRGSDTKKIWRKCIENCGGSTSDDVYIYSIFRKTQEQQDDGWEHVKTPNQSVCWLEVEVENGTNYTVELDGGGTALCTDDFNADDFITVTYLGLQCASPDIEVVVEPELDQCGIGRYKIYLQDNTDVESKNRPNVDPNPVYVYVRPYHDYWIKFPKDAIYDCGADQEVGGVETSADLEVGCDLLAISTLPDERFAATSDPDACYKIFRTYRVINWCEYDGQQDPVVVSRDWDSWNGFDFGTSTTTDDRDPNARREYNINPQFPDGDDNPGNTDLYVIVKRNLNDDLVDRVFYDADSDPTANVGEVSTDQPRFGSGGSGNTDVETYWWQVTSGSRGIVDLAPAGNSSNDYFGDTEANEPDWDLDTNNESYYDGSYRGQPVRWGYDPNVSNADPNGSANDSSDNDDDDQYYGSVGFWQYTQHIIVYDDTAPEVTVEAEQECAINGETCDAETSFDIVITDVCSLDDITLKVYVNGEAASNVALNATDTAVIATVTDRRGLGNYKISGEVNDGCGNITPFDGELEVVDCKAPAPICKENLVVELMPADAGGQQGNTSGSAGMNVLWAKDFIGSPVGDCSGQGPEEILVGNDQYLPMITKYSINRLDSAVADSLTSLVVTCADEGLMVEVEIHAWDELGNHDFCRTSIIVQDNNGVCNLSGATGNIAGVIETEQAAKLEGVEVQLSGAQSRMYMTGQLGDYGFDNLTEGHDFSVIPTKDDDHKNGISTFDLILIQKHILGIAPLESPYQLIAADANNSKSVSTLDLIQIRKLILNIDTELANNTSWRFVDADYTFPNDANPWQEAFPEIRNINNLEGEQIVNFIAVKVGDVNNSANVEARSKQGMFVINTKEQVMTRGNEYTIEFTADLAKIAGYQFTLDVKQAEIVDIIYGAASAEHFGVFPKQGIITTSFNGEAPTENANGILFSVVLRANADVKVSEAIGIGSRYTAAEAYTDLSSQHKLLGVALNFEGLTETSSEFVLNQNMPNPFEGETLIGFNLPQAAEATITLKDVAGRTIKVIEGDFTKGYNEVRVKSNELPTTGVFFYTLTVGELTATKKMIITE